MLCSIPTVITVALASFARAGAVFRQVTELNQTALALMRQQDMASQRAFSNTRIMTSDGRCLFIDELTGDSQANLTPLLVADCGATKGQGWDIVTRGIHNNVDGAMAIVSTLTQACANFNESLPEPLQVNLFTCGGRADGSKFSPYISPRMDKSGAEATAGGVCPSQIFPFDGNSSLALRPSNARDSCLTVMGNVVNIAACDSNNADQIFRFEGQAAAQDGVDVQPEPEPEPEPEPPSSQPPTSSSATDSLPSATESAPVSEPGPTGTVTEPPKTSVTAEPPPVSTSPTSASLPEPPRSVPPSARPGPVTVTVRESTTVVVSTSIVQLTTIVEPTTVVVTQTPILGTAQSNLSSSSSHMSEVTETISSTTMTTVRLTVYPKASTKDSLSYAATVTRTVTVGV